MTLGGLIATLLVALFMSWMVSVPYLRDGDSIINFRAMGKGFLTLVVISGVVAALIGLIVLADQVRLW